MAVLLGARGCSGLSVARGSRSAVGRGESVRWWGAPSTKGSFGSADGSSRSVDRHLEVCRSAPWGLSATSFAPADALPSLCASAPEGLRSLPQGLQNLSPEYVIGQFGYEIALRRPPESPPPLCDRREWRLRSRLDDHAFDVRRVCSRRPLGLRNRRSGLRPGSEGGVIQVLEHVIGVRAHELGLGGLCDRRLRGRGPFPGLDTQRPRCCPGRSRPGVGASQTRSSRRQFSRTALRGETPRSTRAMTSSSCAAVTGLRMCP